MGLIKDESYVQIINDVLPQVECLPNCPLPVLLAPSGEEVGEDVVGVSMPGPPHKSRPDDLLEILGKVSEEFKLFENMEWTVKPVIISLVTESKIIFVTGSPSLSFQWMFKEMTSRRRVGDEITTFPQYQTEERMWTLGGDSAVTRGGGGQKTDSWSRGHRGSGAMMTPDVAPTSEEPQSLAFRRAV